jgi:hypothetical protein
VTAPDSEGGLGSPSADEIAAQLSNPNTTLGSMNMLFDYVAYDGDLRKASRQSAWRGAFQPSLPYPLSGTTNLFVRPLIPCPATDPDNFQSGCTQFTWGI